jgi:iron complex transport system ATP-binding protein
LTALAEARGATVHFDRAPGPALEDVTLVVNPGELVCLLGPNGSGKSTLLRLLAGILAPARGEVQLAGSPAARRPRDEAARLAAFVPQNAAVTFDVTGLEVALMGRHPFGRGLLLEKDADIRLAEEALSLAGALAFRDRPFLSLSGGERQRVVLARAIAQRAPLLLLDEPTSAQDLSNGLEVFALARRLAHEVSPAGGRGVVLATHDVNAAARFADRVVVLARGRVASEGPGETALAPEVLRGVFGIEPFLGKTPEGAPFFVALEPIAEKKP